MSQAQEGIVFLFSVDKAPDSASAVDGPPAETTTSAALYSALDGRAPKFAVMYAVSDLSALPPPATDDPARDRRRVYRVFHDSADTADCEAPIEMAGTTLLAMSATHPDPEVLPEFHMWITSAMQAHPGWRRSRGGTLVEGAPGVFQTLSMHEFAGTDFWESDVLERYVGDPHRVAVISACGGNERRIYHFERAFNCPHEKSTGQHKPEPEPETAPESETED